MNKPFAILSLFVLFAFCSCTVPTGDPITKDFNVEGSYTKLEVSNAFDVTVSQTATQITVRAGENVMPKVMVEIDDNTLKIYLKTLTVNSGSDLSVILPYNADLKNVELSGASQFHSEHGLISRKVEVDLSGASEFYCDLYADEVELDLSGASTVEGNVAALNLDLELTGASDATLVGQVNKLKIDLSGASNILEKIVGNRYGLACDQCEGVMSGGSDAYIHCDGSITVNLSGASDLHYTGNAATSGCTCTGGSNVVHDVL